jgi:hypothetical protein
MLGEIGAFLRSADLPRIRVVLPQRLAQEAVAAWQRDDDGVIGRPEDPAGRMRRHRAGVLALIGLAITERGQRDVNGDILVDLDAELVGVAMDSADDV